MTRIVKKLLLYILLALFFSSASHANEISTITQYSSKQGLSCNYVHDIIQDKHGFIWVATEYGLCRFDGVHFKNYYVEEYPSLYKNQIHRLGVMQDGTLLVGGNNGLLVSYDETTDSFTDLMPDDFNRTYYKGITHFLTDQKNRLWATTTNGAYIYNEKINKFDKHPAITDSTEFTVISDMVIDEWGRHYCGTYTGIVVFDKDGHHLKEYDSMLTLGMIVSSILKMDERHFIVTSFIGGIWMIELSEKGEIHPLRPMKIPFINITSAIIDSKGNYWFGTAGSGLWKATFDGNRFSCKMIEPPNSNSEELKKIHCLFEDKNGDIWIGTQNAGILRYRSNRKIGTLHSSDIEFPMIDGTSFAEDDEGNIYIGADGHGLFVLNTDFQIIKHLTIEDGLTSNNVLCIRKGYDGNLWIAVWGGYICKINPKTFQITQVPFKEIEYAFTTCKVVSPTKDGEVWVATSGAGIYKMNPAGKWENIVLAADTGSLKKSPDTWMEDIIQSPTGTKWAVSSRTVWRFSQLEFHSVFPDIDSHPQHSPLVMLQGACDNDGNLYVVSNQGVLKFYEDGNTYEWLDFLPNGEYQSIIMDKNGRFWTAGSNGVISFNVKEKSYSVIELEENQQTRNYFTCRASFIDSRQNIYFGSAEGFVMFNPKKLNRSETIDYLKLSELTVMGEKQRIGSDLMPKRLSEIESLKLNYNQTSITVGVDIIDFSGLNDVELSYRLRELDKEWINLKSRREISITHIPPGSYQLEVIAKRRGMGNQTESISLPIKVMPPWWRTWWFHTLEVLLIALAIILIVYYRFKRIIKQRETLRKKVEERTEELNQANQLLEKKNKELEQTLNEKDRLLSVIAHDLKNPMFAIVGALDSVLKKRDSVENSWKTIKEIYMSAFNLQTAMVKLLEWARGKRQEMDCAIQDESILALVHDVLSLLSGLVSEKNIQMEVSSENLSHKSLIDNRMISTALRNILSNAIKFTPENGKISIEITENEKNTIVRMCDDGVGMSAEQLHAIVNDENIISTQGTKNERGSGLGLRLAKEYVTRSGGDMQISSRQGEGTTVTIQLPISSELDDYKTMDTGKEVVVEDRFKVNVDLLQGNTVLIVDDDPLILLHLHTVLDPYFNIIEAKNGEDGYEKTLKERPDVILSDVEMPICDGIKMYDNIKQNQTVRDIPLLFLSARTAERDRLLGLYKGAIDYISKPFYDKELLMKLTNILQLRRQQQQKILMQNYDHEKGETTTEVNPMLKKVLDLVSQHYSESGFSADDLSSSMAMSKSTFSRKLKSITDKTPTEILTEYRLHKAKFMLQEGDKSITEIAYSVGFNDPLYFSKKYKAYFGVSPSLQKDSIPK